MLQLNRLSHMVKRELKETFVPKTTVSIIIGTAITTFGLTMSISRRISPKVVSWD